MRYTIKVELTINLFQLFWLNCWFVALLLVYIPTQMAPGYGWAEPRKDPTAPVRNMYIMIRQWTLGSGYIRPLSCVGHVTGPCLLHQYPRYFPRHLCSSYSKHHQTTLDVVVVCLLPIRHRCRRCPSRTRGISTLPSV